MAVAKATEPTVSSKARDLPTQPRENEGLPFVVPADAVVKVANTGIRLVDPHVLLAQGGFVAHLPVSLFNGTGGVEATYYQATGALKSIKQKTSAKLTGAQVEAVGSAILGPLDAKLTANAKEEAAAKAASADTKAAADELLKWKRITDTLNARKSAEALCREFGISPCQ